MSDNICMWLQHINISQRQIKMLNRITLPENNRNARVRRYALDSIEGVKTTKKDYKSIKHIRISKGEIFPFVDSLTLHETYSNLFACAFVAFCINEDGFVVSFARTNTMTSMCIVCIPSFVLLTLGKQIYCGLRYGNSSPSVFAHRWNIH